MKKPPLLFAVSGVKNSGKTTLITQLIPLFVKRGYTVATMKHDGHEFDTEPDHTDTALHRKAGAYGSAVFSSRGIMVVKEMDHPTEKELIPFFPEADVIILEGLKNSPYPKLELVRKGNSVLPVCDPNTVIAYVSDCPLKTDRPIFPFEEIEKIVELILHSQTQ